MIFKKIVLLMFCLISNVSFAVTTVFSDMDWGSLIEPKKAIKEKMFSNPYVYFKANQILFLADGMTEAEGSYSLGAVILGMRQYLKIKIEKGGIVRSSLNCPDEFPGRFTDASEGMLDLHLDNSKKFPLEDDRFDVIAMRRSLCFCKDKDVCCGGVSFLDETGRNFLFETVRVLKKSNPDAVIALHGVIGSQLPRCNSKLSVKEEKAQIKAIESILETIEIEYPNLQCEIIMQKMDNVDLFSGIRIKVKPQEEGLSSALGQLAV